MKNLHDEEIIDSVIKGNEADYALLIDKYKDKAYSLLCGIIKNNLDAEEALQDSFIKAFQSLNTFRKDSKFSTWFYRIVYNTGLSVISSKKHKIQMEMNSIDDFHSLKEADDEIYSLTEDAKDYLISMVDKLPIKNSIVLILFYLDGLTIKEISEVLDLSIVNTKVLLHRSRNSLRDLLLKHNYEEELR